ncbi:MAG: hypothetical protein JWM89_681 [Acidimicrobiales bacterium]|nr:hypothetical protein [Acidimicrobiales bacterium]
MSTEVNTDRPTTTAVPATPRPVRRRTGTGSSPGAARAAAQATTSAREPSSAPPEQPARPIPAPTSNRRTRLPWVLAVVGLVGTLGFATAWASARGDARTGSTATAQTGDAKEIRDAASKFSVALTNFDGATIDRDFDRIMALSTGGFQDQADQFFSSKTRKALKEAQASSRGEVRGDFVQAVSGDRATAFVVVDQTIANNQSPQPKADTLRMELTLAASGGAWKVSRVNVLQAPADGSTLGSTGSSASDGTSKTGN